MRSILLSLLILSTALPATGIGVFDEPKTSENRVAGAIPTKEKPQEIVAENSHPQTQKKNTPTIQKQPIEKQKEVVCQAPPEPECVDIPVCCSPRRKTNYILPALLLAGGGGATAYYLTKEHSSDPYTQENPDDPVDVLLQFRVTIQDSSSYTVPISVTGPDSSLPFNLNYSYTTPDEETVLVPTTALVNAPNGTYTVTVDTGLGEEPAVSVEMLIDGVVVDSTEDNPANFNYTGTP